MIKLSNFILSLKNQMLEGVMGKSSLTKSEVIELFNKSINNTLLEVIGDNVEVDMSDDGTFSWMLPEEKETKEDKAKRITNNLKDKIENSNSKIASRTPVKTEFDNEITDKQRWAIKNIEKTLKEIKIRFKGETKQDAIAFIGEYIGKTIDDLIPKGVL